MKVEFQGEEIFFFLHCMLLIAKMKFSLRQPKKVVWRNSRNVSESFDTADACVLTATLWSPTRGFLYVHTSNDVNN